MPEKTLKRVIAISMKYAKERPEKTPTRGTHFIDDLGFDSLSLIEMALEIEEVFKLEIPDGDVDKMRTIGHLVDYLREHHKSA